jgi:hypothetical protein
MTFAPHVFFAKDRGGYYVSARDTFALSRGEFFCASCGQAVRLAGTEKLPHFRHVSGPECPGAGQRALLGAAQAVLVESRFIKVPPRGHAVFEPLYKQPVISHEQWVDSVCNLEVEGVTIDFVAEQPEGKLLVHFSIPGILDNERRDQIRQLGLPALEVAFAKPSAIDSFAELGKVLLHSIENKRWLVSDTELAQMESRFEFTPALALASEEFRSDGFRTSKPVYPDNWTSVGALVGNALYREFVPSRKIAELEKLMGHSCDKWPTDIGLAVKGQECFGCDPRIWQADAYARFVAGAEGVRDAVFTSDNVLKYLGERYHVTEVFQNAPVMAVYAYLKELVSRGTLLEPSKGRFKVVLNQALAEHKLVWHPYCPISVSTLRRVASEAGLQIPVSAFRWLLESFEAGHPSMSVASFVQLFALQAHVPLRQVIAFLLDADLIWDEGVGQAVRQGSLFGE